MKKIKNPLNAKIVVRPSHPVLKIAVTALIVFSTAALIALAWVHGAILRETDLLADEVSAIEYANEKLDQRIQNPDSIQNVQDVAREELGLVDPKTIIIDPK